MLKIVSRVGFLWFTWFFFSRRDGLPGRIGITVNRQGHAGKSTLRPLLSGWHRDTFLPKRT